MSSPATVELPGIRSNSASAELHPESLLRIPLVHQAFHDGNFRLIRRGVDSNWTYSGTIPVSMTGFNPFECAFFYGQNSLFEQWLSNPCGSARSLNENDLLVKEVLFMAHDYLHAWAYQTIDSLCPALRVFDGPLTSETLEDYTFCHLLTEAAATVGLDYWLLSERSVNEYCPIGTNVGPLTVSYREARLPEYRRWQPGLCVQAPEFFGVIAAFYCTGEFPGFAVDDLRRSPQLLAWLRHELSYGATQRVLTRSWLAFLANGLISLPDDLSAAIPVASDWRRTLIQELGQRLWVKVKENGQVNRLPLIRRRITHARHSDPFKAPDFRFLNLARTELDRWRNISGPDAKACVQFFLHQYVSGIPFNAVTPELEKLIVRILEQQDIEMMMAIVQAIPRLDPSSDEPHDLFLAN